MLINATHAEELRVALVDGQRLYNLDIESESREQKNENIYKARVTRVEPSLEAAFVDFGASRHGFLPLKEVSHEYFPESAKGGRPTIKQALREGQEIIVQVEKEERGNKGAALTTLYSLAGRYLALTRDPKAGGVSRRMSDEERKIARASLAELEFPKNMGVIVRTAAVGHTTEELQWDLDYLLQLSEMITSAAEAKAPFLIHQARDVIIRALRDYVRDDIGEIIIDSPAAKEHAQRFIDDVMPQFSSRVKLYDGSVPLFNRYQIEGQIESAFNREVRLPSGGSIVIDPTEALVSIDINSARATKGADIEETALNTNLEAADEVARQLRLRDIGGLMVIDFIDMSSSKNQRAVENRMREALSLDRARVQTGRISRFGLLEMSRQRLRPSLVETSGSVCPRCNGLGSIRDVESLAFSVIRLVEEEALKESSAEIRAILPVPVASFLLNEKRDSVVELEARHGVKVVIVPSPELETPQFTVERIREAEAEESAGASYELTPEVEEPQVPERTQAAPAVPVLQPPTPSPRPAPQPAQAEPAAARQTREAPPTPARQTQDQPAQQGFFARLIGAFFPSEPEPEPEPEPRRRKRGGRRRGGNDNRGRRGGRGRGGNENRDDNQREGRGEGRRDDSRGNEGGEDGRSGNGRRGGGRRGGGRRNGRRGEGRGDNRRDEEGRRDGGNGDERLNDDSRQGEGRRDDNRRDNRRDNEPRQDDSREEQRTNGDEGAREAREGGGRSRRRGGRGRGRGDRSESTQTEESAAPAAEAQVSEDDSQDRETTSSRSGRRRSGSRRSRVERMQAEDAAPTSADDPADTPAEDATAEGTDAVEPATAEATTTADSSAQVDAVPETPAATEPAASAGAEPPVSQDAPDSTAVARSDSTPADTAEAPSAWGRAANDPRQHPVASSADVVTLDATPREVPPALSESSRNADDEHPSVWGRAANDPREDSNVPAAEITDGVIAAGPDPLPEVRQKPDAEHPSNWGRAPNDPRGGDGIAAG